MDEATLQELLSFLRCEGKWRWLGGSFATYPGRDEEQQRKYDYMVELERRGLARRKTWDDQPGIVLFVATEENDTPTRSST